MREVCVDEDDLVRSVAMLKTIRLFYASVLWFRFIAFELEPEFPSLALYRLRVSPFFGIGYSLLARASLSLDPT
jgi:hypothetical protein